MSGSPKRPQSVSMELSYSKAVEKLGPDYRSQIKAFETKLMKGLESTGLHIEPINGCKAEGIRSGRVNDDVRAILLIDPLTLLYVDHHEQAYEWARRRQVSASSDGRKITVYDATTDEMTEPGHEFNTRPDLFGAYTDEYLEEVIGVPAVLIPPLRGLADASEILELEGRIPGEVLDRLLDIAEGRIPDVEVAPPVADEEPGAEPEVVGAVPLDENTQETLDIVAKSDRRQWLEFIGAKQKRLAQDNYDRPIVLTGPAGTGKTVVLLHRAATMAKLGKKVLLVTVGRTLAMSMKADLDLMAKDAEWRDNVDVRWLHDLICELRNMASHAGIALPTEHITYGDTVERALDEASETIRGDEKRRRFWYLDEWNLILEPQAIVSLDQYLEAERPGRGEALQRAQRQQEWPVFQRAVELLEEQGLTPLRYVLRPLIEAYTEGRAGLPHWPYVLVDEMQDFGPARLQLMLLLAEDPAGVFLAGDTSQRLHVPPLDVAALGVDVMRRRLTRSHRTTETIRHFVEVDLALRDKSDRSNGSRSGGQEPEVHHFDSEAAEFSWIAARCQEWASEGYDLADVGITVKDKASAVRMIEQLKKRRLPCHLVQAGSVSANGVAVLHYHLAKGLEFNAVVVAQLTSEVLEPSKYDWMPDDQKADRLTVQHNLIYVALTRAREQLIVTCGGPLPERLRGHRLVVDHGAEVSVAIEDPADGDDDELDDIPF